MSETNNIEYKESWRDEYLRQICGLANTHGGSFFIGIDDNGNVIDVNKPKKLQEDIPNKVKDTFGIIPDMQIRHKDNLDYIEIIVAENATPVSYKNKFYYRSGTVTLELTGPNLHTFLLEKMGGKWEYTHMQFSEILGVHPETIRRQIGKLKELGLIRREGSDKTGFWVILEQKESSDV